MAEQSAQAAYDKAASDERKANMGLIFGTIDNDAHKAAVKKRKAAEAALKVEQTK